MKIIKISRVFFFLILLCLSCKEEPLETIYSSIDGQEYYNDMSADMSIRKATRLILEDKANQVPNEFILLISDSLNTENKKWKEMYFDAFSLTIDQLNEKQRLLSAPSVFE